MLSHYGQDAEAQLGNQAADPGALSNSQIINPLKMVYDTLDKLGFGEILEVDTSTFLDTVTSLDPDSYRNVVSYAY